MEQAQDDYSGLDILKFCGILAVLALVAAVLKLGTIYYFTKEDLKLAQCQAAYWKGVSQKKPNSFCPPGCTCDSRMLR